MLVLVSHTSFIVQHKTHAADDQITKLNNVKKMKSLHIPKCLVLISKANNYRKELTQIELAIQNIR